MRVGFGYDTHQLAEGRPLIIGGVEIPHEKGLLGHSDADVLIHAIIDAILGALALGDIGKHFPDTDPRFKDADSRVLLREVSRIIHEQAAGVINIDSTIIAERPRMLPHIDHMRKNLSDDLGIDVSRVSVKATTNEKMGFLGREEGIVAMAVALVEEDVVGTSR